MVGDRHGRGGPGCGLPAGVLRHICLEDRGVELFLNIHCGGGLRDHCLRGGGGFSFCDAHHVRFRGPVQLTGLSEGHQPQFFYCFAHDLCLSTLENHFTGGGAHLHQRI